MGRFKDRNQITLNLFDFLAKLGIKSAKRSVPPFITGKHVQFYLDGVKLEYAQGVDYVVDNSCGPIVLRSDD